MSLWPANDLTPQHNIKFNSELWLRKTGIRPIYTSGTWSASNLIVYTPFLVQRTYRRTRFIGLATLAGSVSSGNAIFGLYEDAGGYPGAKVWSDTQRGAFAADFYSTNMWNFVGVGGATVYINPGIYWGAFALNNTTAQVTRLVAASTNGMGIVAGSIHTETRDSLSMPDVATPSFERVAVNVPMMALWTA